MYGGCFNFLRHGYWGGGVMMFIGFIVIVAVVYLLMKKQQPTSTVNPIDLLNTKYVNGEIGKEEYEEKLEILKRNK